PRRAVAPAWSRAAVPAMEQAHKSPRPSKARNKPTTGTCSITTWRWRRKRPVPRWRNCLWSLRSRWTGTAEIPSHTGSVQATGDGRTSPTTRAATPEKWPYIAMLSMSTWARKNVKCSMAPGLPRTPVRPRSEEHTSELQSRFDLVCRLLLEKKNTQEKHTERDKRDDKAPTHRV